MVIQSQWRNSLEPKRVRICAAMAKGTGLGWPILVNSARKAAKKVDASRLSIAVGDLPRASL